MRSLELVIRIEYLGVGFMGVHGAREGEALSLSPWLDLVYISRWVGLLYRAGVMAHDKLSRELTRCKLVSFCCSAVFNQIVITIRNLECTQNSMLLFGML